MSFLNPSTLFFLSILYLSNRCDPTTYHDSFSQKMMLKMQAGLKDAKVKEDRAKATEESLQKAISDLKEKLNAVNATSTSSSSSAAATAAAATAAAPAATVAETAQLVSSSATEKSQANEDAVMATAPIEGAEKNDIQVVDKAETQSQKSSSNADPSTETYAPDANTTLNTEANSHAAAKAEVTEMSSEASAKQGETIITATDVVTPGKKKGRKRKANAPNKNAVPGSEVEVVEAAPPPQKKTTTQAVATKVETPSVTEAQPATEIIKNPPRQKTPTQAKTSSVTTAKPAAEIAIAPSQKELEMKLKLEL